MPGIGKAGPDKKDETVVSFRRNESGTFTKVTTILTRDWKTGGVTQKKSNEPVEEGPYASTTNPDECDETIEYEDIDGSTQYLYFKKLPEVADE